MNFEHKYVCTIPAFDQTHTLHVGHCHLKEATAACLKIYQHICTLVATIEPILCTFQEWPCHGMSSAVASQCYSDLPHTCHPQTHVCLAMCIVHHTTHSRHLKPKSLSVNILTLYKQLTGMRNLVTSSERNRLSWTAMSCTIGLVIKCEVKIQWLNSRSLGDVLDDIRSRHA